MRRSETTDVAIAALCASMLLAAPHVPASAGIQIIAEPPPIAVPAPVYELLLTPGKTLRQNLIDWCGIFRCTLIWTASTDYPISAQARFQGGFEAIVRGLHEAMLLSGMDRLAITAYTGNQVLYVGDTPATEGSNPVVRLLRWLAGGGIKETATLAIVQGRWIAEGGNR